MSRSTSPTIQPVERFFQFSLLALLTSGFFAVVGSGYVDTPATVVTAVALFVRALMVAGVVQFELSNRATALLTLVYIAFYVIDYQYISRGFLPATVHLIFFLATVKILTARSNRDYFFVKVIALLELLAAAVLSGSPTFFAFLAVFLLSGVCTFAASEIRRSAQLPRRVSRAAATTRFHWHLAGLSVSTAIGILLLTGALFFLLPRTARAAFRHFVPERYHLAGFSNEVELGQIGEIRRTATPVMHVRIDNIEHALPLKWRGAALTEFDGRRWFNPYPANRPIPQQEGEFRLADERQRWRQGARISYQVVLQAIDSDNLFFAGIPEFVRIGLPSIFRTSTDSYRTGLGTGDGVRYYAYSYLPQEGIGTVLYNPGALPEAMRQQYLQLPRMNPRIAELTKQLTGRAATDYEAADIVSRHLRTSYGYTTELPDRKEADPIGHFLFERRKGHCEYFASALAVMLRQMGIPARVVTGFQSGTYNPITGWHVIRTSDAHSWVEAYLDRRGWTTFDPTPPDPGSQSAGFWTRLNMIADAAETFWREWVLNYDRERQIDLATRIESRRSWSFAWMKDVERQFKATSAVAAEVGRLYGLRAVLVVAAAAALLLLGPRLRDWLRKRRQAARLERGEVRPHDGTVLYGRMLAALRRRGYEKPPWLTPAEFAGVLPASPESTLVQEITAAYQELRFGCRPEAARRMMSLIMELETR